MKKVISFVDKRRVLFLFLLVFLVLPIRQAAIGAEKGVRTPSVSTAAVTLNGKVIMVVNERLLSLSAQERAERATSRIKMVFKNPLAKTEDIKSIDGELTTDIAWKDFVIMSITDKDAKAEGTTRQELAKIRADLIRKSIDEARKSRGVKNLFLGTLFAVLYTLILVILIKMINHAYQKWLPSIDTWSRKIPSLRVQKLELIPAERISDLTMVVLKVGYFTLLILLGYVYIPLVFSLFPWTKGLAPTLFGFILSPLQSVFRSVIGFIPNFFFISVVFVCVHYSLKMVAAIFKEVSRGRIAFPGFYREWADPTFQILRFLVWAFTLVIVFPYLPGSDSPAFKGVSVFLGVLFSLGSSSAISNAMAGIILTYMRPFSLGDRIKVGENVGDVIEKTLLVTRVRTIKNVDITVPNAIVLGNAIVNYSSSAEERGLILHTTVTIGYDAPWPKVHELLMAAAKETEHILSEPAPFVLQKQLGDFSVSYELNASTKKANLMATIYSQLHENIQNKFNEAGVEIMSPIFEVRRTGPENTIPDKYRKKTNSNEA